jgi:hypothetical protein
MKTKVFGFAVALLALVSTAASAATKVAGTGCCPLCK